MKEAAGHTKAPGKASHRPSTVAEGGSARSTVHPMLQLQRAAGNRAVQRLLPRKPGNDSGPAAIPAAVDAAVRSPGQPLDPAVRGFMESRLDDDFGEVRVHTDSAATKSADALGANAYTSGHDIYFASGKFAPQSSPGKGLLAHELVHTIQQRGNASSVACQRAPGSATVDPDASLEQDAERAGNRILSASPGHSLPGAIGTTNGKAAIQRSPSDTLPEPLMPLGFASIDLAIDGPLAPGTVIESHGLTVTQTDALHAKIVYGDSWVDLEAYPGDVYVFSIGLPIAQPPVPQTDFGPLFNITDPDAKPELPQRVVRVTSTRSVTEQHIDQDARVLPLAVQTRIATAGQISEEGAGLIGPLEVAESTGDDYAQLHLEDSMIRIEASSDEGMSEAEPRHARFAYWIDPEWTGAYGNEKLVVIVAAPGVTVRIGSPEYAPTFVYGRKLVPEVIRVPHANLVPEQGGRIAVEQFVSVNVVDPDASTVLGLPDFIGAEANASPHRREVDIATGLAGVSISHPWSGAHLTLRPANAEVGAAYAWQVLPPVDGSPGEIRAVVGPGVVVELLEPAPTQMRREHGGFVSQRDLNKLPAGEGLRDQSFDLKLVEVDNPVHIPPQGTPLNIDYLAGFGHLREPDRHQWLKTEADEEAMIGTAVLGSLFSAIPIVGQLYAIGEFTFFDGDRIRLLGQRDR